MARRLAEPHQMAEDQPIGARKIASAIAYRVARVFLSAGLSFGDFQEIARSEFCRAAQNLIESRGERATTSRIAVLTGLSRSDVSKTRRLTSVPSSRAHYKARTDRVMHGWHADPDFTNQFGEPLPLPIKGSQSLDALCKRYSGDIPTRALMQELIARGMIQATRENLYMPSAGTKADFPLLPVDAEEISASAGVFFDAALGDRSRNTVSRISATFGQQRVPPHVVRTCKQRTTRFISALSSYIFSESQNTTLEATDRTASLNIVVVSNEETDEKAVIKSKETLKNWS